MSPECKALELKAARFSTFLLKICFIEAGLRTSYLEELLDRAQSHGRPDLAYNTLHITTRTRAWVVLRQNVKVVGNW